MDGVAFFPFMPRRSHVSQERSSRPIRSVGIVGAGVMGQAIAVVNARQHVPVRIMDPRDDSVSAALDHIRHALADSPELADLVTGTTSDREVAASDLVLEAVVEKLGVKKEILARLEPMLGDEAILASNTSTIPITRLAADLAHPERFCGLHFCNPHQMRLVEVVPGARTSRRVAATAASYVRAIGATPLVVGDGPGFLVNRLLVPYMNEALELLLEGAGVEVIERAATSFGMPVGPITMFDVVGIDVALLSGLTMYEAFPERIVASELLIAMYKAGRRGQKSGAGFFSYDQNQEQHATFDDQVQAIIARRIRGRRDFTPEEITLRLFLPMVLEASRVLEAGLVDTARAVDLGVNLGLGFPASKGGLLHWADTLGPANIVRALAPFQPLGKRYEPTETLLAMARAGTGFYEPLRYSSRSA